MSLKNEILLTKAGFSLGATDFLEDLTDCWCTARWRYAKAIL